MNQALSFDDVVLLPRSHNLENLSRDSINLKLEYFNTLPIMNAPMHSIINAQNCIEYHRSGVFTVVPFDVWKEVSESDRNEMLYSGNAIGIAIRYNQLEEYCKYILTNGLTPYSSTLGFKTPLYHFLDTANGYDYYRGVKFMSTLERVGVNCNEIVLGNIATPQGIKSFNYLMQPKGVTPQDTRFTTPMIPSIWRVGIGCGGACLTTVNTGIGMPTLQSVMDCSTTKGTVLIADGGMKTPGDVCKALRLGASFAMLGSYFSGCVGTDSTFYGEASALAKGHKKYIEGDEIPVTMTQDTIQDRVQRLKDGIASMLSYVGMRSVDELSADKTPLESRFVQVTQAGRNDWQSHARGRL